MAAPGTSPGSCQHTGSSWIRAAQHLQEHERQELRAAGRRKLQELKARLRHADASAPVTMRVSDSSCSTDSSLASPASITSSTTTNSSSTAATPAGRMRTLARTSADSNATASSTSGSSCCEEQQGGSYHAAPAAAPVAAAAGSCAEEAAGGPADTPSTQADAASRRAVAAPPSAAGDDDPMVHMLLAQVGALMSERQQLACKCDGLERENEQLAELVGHLNVALEETQLDAELQQQQQQLAAGGPTPPPPAALVLAHQQQQRVAEWLEQRAEQGSQGSHDWVEWQERLLVPANTLAPARSSLDVSAAAATASPAGDA